MQLKNCDEKSIKLLIAAGADVNIKNKYGFTALHISIRNRSEKCVYSLVDAGADVNMEDSDYLTPVMEAVVFECRECLNGKHLIKIDPHGNLFGRVPRLGLPTSLTSYLLYDATLDDDEEDEDDDDDNDGGMIPWRDPHIKMRNFGIIRNKNAFQ